MYTQCTRNMLETTFVSHTQPWKHHNIVNIAKNKKITCVSLSHREIAISSPFRDPKNDPEASISTESALMCTHCTRNMLGTTFVSHTKPWKTLQHRQIVKNKKITLFHCHIGKSQLLAPSETPKTTQRHLMCSNVL